MGILYSAHQTSTALSTTADSVTLKGGVAGSCASGMLREFTVSGGGTASAANEVILSRCTGGTVATAMFGLNTNAPTSFILHGLAQATTVTTTLYRFGLNANGALFRWVAAPGMAVEFQGGTTPIQVGLRSASGTSLATTTMVAEQI